ncbi:MAG: hypothetical protein RR835_04480 [Peptostreptococcaceae bacterium]
MKKWIWVLVLVLILFINPNKINMLSKNNSVGKDIKLIKDIEVNDDIKYEKYDDDIVLCNDKKIMVIDSNGEIISKLDINKEISEYNMYSNHYIDIVNKKDNRAFSINKKGQTLFGNDVLPETILYTSVNQDRFVTSYKNKNKEYIKIQDIEESIINTIEITGKVIHLDVVGEYIVVADIQTNSTVQSEIIIYDQNGNQQKGRSFEDIIIDLITTDENIYLVFENYISVLDTKLNEKYKIDVNKIKDINKNEDNTIGIIDNSKKLIELSGKEGKNIKIKQDVIGSQKIGKDYITYSEYSIYNKDNKEIAKFEEKIKDVVYLGKKNIMIYFDKHIKLFKIS